jgi:hypothetical protein
MICNIFASLFGYKFVPTIGHHLDSNKLEEKALLLFDHCPAHSSADVLKLKDAKIKAMFLPQNTITQIS